MKPSEKKPEIIFRNIDIKTGEAVGSYSRAYCDEYDFRSKDAAWNANCHGMFKDKEKYKIAKYRVTYELIEDDIDTSDLEERDKPKYKSSFERMFAEAMQKDLDIVIKAIDLPNH